jgi:hypothetical protein
MRTGFLILSTSLLALALQAKDIIEVTSQSRVTPGGTVIDAVNHGENSIPDVISDLINGAGHYSVFSNDPVVDAQLKALGVANAITLNLDASAPTIVTAQLRTISGLNRTFTGASRADVEAQVKEFLKKEGAAELAHLLNYLNAASPISVNNGNPNSSVALAAQGVFDQYGFVEGRTNAELEEGLDPSYEVAIRGDVGLIEANGYKAQSYSLPISFSVFERERWALRAQMPLNYTDVEGAQIFRAGLNLSMPIMVIGNTKERKSQWYWQLTPSGGSQATASEDLVAGGIMNNAGLTSALEYRLGPDYWNIAISMGNQITFVESMELAISDVKFDPNVSAQVLKNGLKVSVPFMKRWVFDVYAIDTRFFGDDTYSDGYETVGAAVGYRRAKGAFFKVGSYAHLAKDFTSANFHFGTGWKF